MKRARDASDDDAQIVRAVRPRQPTSCCGLLDWLPPEMRSHVRAFLGLRDRHCLHRVCRLLHDEDEHPLSEPMLAFLASTSGRTERKKFWQCVDILEKVGVTAWPEFTRLHIDHGYRRYEVHRGENVFYWRLPCYLAYAEDMTQPFAALRFVFAECSSGQRRIDDMLQLQDPWFRIAYTAPFKYWSGGTSAEDTNPYWLARHRQWLRQTIAAESDSL